MPESRYKEDAAAIRSVLNGDKDAFGELVCRYLPLAQAIACAHAGNWADAEDLDFPGQSFVQMITTSHCSLHFFDHEGEDNEIYFDLYSCKAFDTDKVVQLLDEKFGLRNWHGILYTRATGEEPQLKKIEGKKQAMEIRN